MTKRAMLVGAVGGMAAGTMMAAVEMIYGWVSSVHRLGRADGNLGLHRRPEPRRAGHRSGALPRGLPAGARRSDLRMRDAHTPGDAFAFPLIDAQAVPWLSVEQMREVDRIMVEELAISLARMMENAGRNLAELARHLLGGDSRGRPILVLAGPGGNGGGGLVAARHLMAAGAQVEVALSAPADAFAPVPAEQLQITRKLGIPIHHRTGSLRQPALVIDALLGYSQRGEPDGAAAELIRWSANRRMIALDVPSGLELTSGRLWTPHVAADATMTLAAPKTALAAPTARAVTGRLYLADISVPGLVYERLGLSYRTPFTQGPIVELGARIRG